MNANPVTPSDLHTCRRCAGTGTVRAHINVLGGRCFGCGGSGKVRKVTRKAHGTATLVIWNTGMATLHHSPKSLAVGWREERDGTVEYVIPGEHYEALRARHGITDADIDEETDAARAARDEFYARANAYGMIAE